MFEQPSPGTSNTIYMKEQWRWWNYRTIDWFVDCCLMNVQRQIFDAYEGPARVQQYLNFIQIWGVDKQGQWCLYAIGKVCRVGSRVATKLY